ncbi:endothelial cell-specific chemotaxis regulator [Neoarius graeffei]|uniref:endothelial cell-specific chemotaxis regulator n=1 Tax=Neoarius graeffei TaxID=443677 RepID=UPI00298D2E76|nr:endothelial cell-specific chemotaxis regulator [Neoarius graeffei]
MALLLYPFIVLCMSVSLVAETSKSPELENPVTTSSVNVTQLPVADSITSSRGLNVTFLRNLTGGATEPTQTPDNGLTTLAFGVMSFILILIVVMVILVTTVNVKGRCHNTKEEGVKNYGSVISEGHISNTGEKESIMLVSMRSINTDTDTDSARISSIYSTALDNEDQ